MLAFRAVQHKRRAALRANQRVRLQRRAAGGAALAFAVWTDVGRVGHLLTAVRTRLEFFFEGEAAVWTFCIDRADLVSAFGAGQRPRLAAVEAGRGAGGHRLMTLRAKFLAAVITDIGIAGQFGKAAGAFHAFTSTVDLDLGGFVSRSGVALNRL
jgi:hypothetical protein